MASIEFILNQFDEKEFMDVKKFDLSRFFVAEDEDKVIGCAGYEARPGNKCRTKVMVVLPEYQGYGIGRRLTIVRLNAAKKEGFKACLAVTARKIVVPWFKRLGFVETAQHKKKETDYGDIDHWKVLELDLLKYKERPC